MNSLEAEIERLREKAQRIMAESTCEGQATHQAEPDRESEWLRRAGVGRRHIETAIDEAQIPAECFAWRDLWARGGNLILSGTVGVGKTIAAVWCLRAVFASRERLRPDFSGVLFVKQAALYRAVFNRDTHLIERARSASVLVIDEWGGAYESEWPLAELDGMIDDRYSDRRATILTTNTHPTEGPGNLLDTAPRAYDRLRDAPGPGVVMLDRESLRGPS